MMMSRGGGNTEPNETKAAFCGPSARMRSEGNRTRLSNKKPDERNKIKSFCCVRRSNSSGAAAKAGAPSAAQRHKKAPHHVNGEGLLPSLDTCESSPQTGAERATQVKNSTHAAESQDPVDNFRNDNRTGNGAPDAAHGTRRSRERAAKSGTQAGGHALPESPSGAAGAGGKQGEPSDHGSSRDRRAASAGRPARAGNPSPPPARRGTARQRRAAGGGPERARAKPAGTQANPPRGHALHKPQARAQQGRPTGNPKPRAQEQGARSAARAAAKADGPSERPRSAQARTRAERGSGGERSDRASGPRAPERTQPRAAGRVPDAECATATATAKPTRRDEREPEQRGTTALGLGARRRERPAGTGAAHVAAGPDPETPSLWEGLPCMPRKSRRRFDGPKGHECMTFWAVRYLILGHYSVMTRE